MTYLFDPAQIEWKPRHKPTTVPVGRPAGSGPNQQFVRALATRPGTWAVWKRHRDIHAGQTLKKIGRDQGVAIEISVEPDENEPCVYLVYARVTGPLKVR